MKRDVNLSGEGNNFVYEYTHACIFAYMHAWSMLRIESTKNTRKASRQIQWSTGDWLLLTMLPLFNWRELLIHHKGSGFVCTCVISMTSRLAKWVFRIYWSTCSWLIFTMSPLYNWQYNFSFAKGSTIYCLLCSVFSYLPGFDVMILL